MEIFNFERKTSVEISRLLAGRIRAVRRRRRISQQRLSEASGVSLGSLKRFEQTGEVALLSLIKIAIALEIDDELLHLFEEVKPLSIEEILYEQDQTP
ncbi:MAG: transcriptional regulator [Lachnospiraceae bacterium]|nr:transcriptional regulator [Lachnospiraceae bacterium]